MYNTPSWEIGQRRLSVRREKCLGTRGRQGLELDQSSSRTCKYSTQSTVPFPFKTNNKHDGKTKTTSTRIKHHCRMQINSSIVL